MTALDLIALNLRNRNSVWMAMLSGAILAAVILLCTPGVSSGGTDITKPRGTLSARSVTAGNNATDNAGQALLEARCTACHTLNRVEDATYSSLAQWTTLVGRMVSKGAALSSSEQASLASYLDRSYGTDPGDLYTASTNIRLYHRAYDRPIGGTSADGGVVVAMRASSDGLFNDVVGEEAWRAYQPWSDWILPSGDGSKTLYIQFNDDSSNGTPSITDKIILDTRAPVVTVTTPKYVSTSYKRNSFVTKWTGKELGLGVSGIKDYVIERRTVPKGTFAPWLSATTSSSGTTVGKLGTTYEFRAKATDNAGNEGVFSTAVKSTVPYDDDLPKYYGKWVKTKSPSSPLYMGTARYTKARGAKATFRFKGKSIALLVTKGPGRGKAAIYIDGKFLRTIDTKATRQAYRQVIQLKTFTDQTVGHRLTVVNRKTFGRPRLDLDGFIIAR